MCKLFDISDCGCWILQFRDTVRLFIKGTDGVVGSFAQCLCGSPHLYQVLYAVFHFTGAFEVILKRFCKRLLATKSLG